MPLSYSEKTWIKVKSAVRMTLLLSVGLMFELAASSIFASPKTRSLPPSFFSLVSFVSQKMWWHSNDLFIISVVHCLAQGIIQSFLFSVDNEYSALLSGIVKAAEVPSDVIPNLMGDLGHYTLQVCNDIPHGQPVNPCITVFKSGQGNFSVTPGFRRSVRRVSCFIVWRWNW